LFRKNRVLAFLFRSKRAAKPGNRDKILQSFHENIEFFVLASNSHCKRRMETEIEIALAKNAELRKLLAAQEASKRSAAARKYADLAERRRKLAENAAEILFLRQTLQARRIAQALAETPLDRIRRLEQSNYWLRRLKDEQEQEQRART